MSERIVYVPLADVATACGISAYHLLNHHWPTDWAVPRNWRMIPRSSIVLVAEGSLPQLVAELQGAGLADAAERLAEWCAERTGLDLHENFMARPGATMRPSQEPWWKKGQFA